MLNLQGTEPTSQLGSITASRGTVEISGTIVGDTVLDSVAGPSAQGVVVGAAWFIDNEYPG